MDVALIKHAEDDVDDDNGCQNQEWLALKRGAEFRCAAGKSGRHCFGQTDLLFSLLNGINGRAERTAGREIERQGNGGELALVQNGERGRASLDSRKSAERDHLAGG